MLAALISSPPLPASWNELCLMLGTASAALIGLLFVATSLHLAEIANEDIYRLRAQYTTLISLSTLVQSTVVLVPQPMKILGFELLAINLWACPSPSRCFPKRSRFRLHVGGGFSVRRRSVFIAGYVIGIVGAGAVATGREWGMYGVTAYTLLLFNSIWNGWTIMRA